MKASIVVGRSVSGERPGVVDHDAGPAADADPVAVVRAEARVHELERRVGQGRETALRGDGPEGTGVLGEEHVGGRCIALLEDGRGEVRRPGVVHLDVDAGLGLEALDDRADEFLAAAGVDRQRAGWGGAGRLARRLAGRGSGRRGAGRAGTACRHGE